jgi:hypothetical protein
VTTRKEQNFEKEKKEEIKRYSEKGSQESSHWRREEGQEGTS